MSQSSSGQPPAKPNFAKPWLSCADQVQLLQQRGLVVAAPTAAEQFLSHLNYYRFSGHHLAYVRNLCAHHSRLWDRVWAIKPESPAGKNWEQPLLPGNNRLFCTLLLRQMMKRIPAVTTFATEWKARVETHIANPPSTPDPLPRMGLTANWGEHPVWL